MDNKSADSLIRDHRRQWRDCLYIYPVIARRSKGLSIGVNLNPEKTCNYSCVYCQVDRGIQRGLHDVQLPILHDELLLALRQGQAGQLWQEHAFSKTPKSMRRINDIAFSGDGEPTCLANFDQAVKIAAEVKKQLKMEDVKLVVITNATMLQSPQFLRALPTLDANNGEIWAKLDAGSEEYFNKVNRPHGQITLRQIIDNIVVTALDRPVVIQTLFASLAGSPPTRDEIQAYCDRLTEILDRGGQIKLVQVHTVARAPAEDFVQPLTKPELDLLAKTIRLAVPSVPVETFYSSAK
jgi:wyosine [tRNA(Phe)-imidazoG37] synthetase (radical SAM superfamily)